MNIGLSQLQGPGILLPQALQSQVPLGVNPWPMYPQMTPQIGGVPPFQTTPATSAQNVKSEVSDRDVRVLKRKQANRDSARRSKQKKKQETEELGVRRAQLSDTNQELIQKVREAQARVRQLQETNGTLKQRYQCLVESTEAGTS